MMKWLGELVDRIFVVVGALVFSQGPLMIQQYTQRLGGHVAELQLQIDAMQKVARQSGKTLKQYIHKFLSSGDVDFTNQGIIMQGMQKRFANLSDSLAALHHSSVVTKPFVFLRHLDFDIFTATVWSFQPGILFTFEGVIYAIFGMLIGYASFRFFKLIICRKDRKKAVEVK